MSAFITTPVVTHSSYPAFYGNIKNVTLDNVAYRNVISTTPTMQLVVMTLKPSEDIGEEIHPYTTQFIRVESGKGMAHVGDKYYVLDDDITLIIPPGTRHNIMNTSTLYPLKLYTIYSPPEHPETLTEMNKPK